MQQRRTGSRAEPRPPQRGRSPGPFRVGGVTVQPGERRHLEIPVARLPTHTFLSLPVAVVHGVAPGPRLWVSAAIHGDEYNGIEVIRRVLERIRPDELHGTLLAVPIVNVFGFINRSRYLPDRRDLNRCFPGSPRGSMAARLAHLFMTEVVGHCTYGIDLHTASHHRINLPQIRANLKDPETRRCAEAFGAPLMIHSDVRDGSLRQATTKRGVAALLFEGGEALRFNPDAIRVGVDGVLRVMRALGMGRFTRTAAPPGLLEVRRSTWVRARQGGVLRLSVKLGQRVTRRQELGTIGDAFGGRSLTIPSPVDGVVIGQALNPMVFQGDAVVHVGEVV